MSLSSTDAGLRASVNVWDSTKDGANREISDLYPALVDALRRAMEENAPWETDWWCVTCDSNALGRLSFGKDTLTVEVLFAPPYALSSGHRIQCLITPKFEKTLDKIRECLRNCYVYARYKTEACL